MPTEEPLATLNRRLGAQPGSIDDADAEAEDGQEDFEGAIPSWVPDGRPARGQAWLAAIRADPGRAGGIAMAVVAALAVLITVFTLARHRPAPVVSANLPPVETVPSSLAGSAPRTTPAVPEPSGQPLVVSVVGLVQQPGLVTVTPDARVADAVSAAGGMLHGADTLGLNLARHLADGEQIVVGIATPAGRRPALGSSVGGPATGPAPPATPVKPVGPVDLNAASADELDALPGVGPVTAAAIVAWRSANGRFDTVDQLGEVDGIGPARLERLRPLVRV
jgi:competence protein ComEA